MLTENGSLQLQDFTDRNFQEAFTQVTEGVWHVSGLGHSNAVVLEGNTGVILIDTLDTLERGERLLHFIREKTGKEVKTVIFTHSHPDHRGGAGAFLGSDPEIIAFAPKTPALEGSELLQQIQNRRGSRQFGYTLTDEENISQGIGRREGVVYGEHRAFTAPSTVYQEDSVSREIDGISLEMARLPGETDDQICVWLPQKRVLCCGDNYYGCFPNFYAIRGGQYRDLSAWRKSIDALLAYPADYLLPGHTAVIYGNDNIREVLGNFRDVINYILTKTLEGMNEGKSQEELAAEIRLPEQYAVLPYLGEFYGCVEWTVRAVYTAYLGWFDGNPTKLGHMATKERAEKTVSMMGGPARVLAEGTAALKRGEAQWAAELCDLLLACRKETEEASVLKADALTELGRAQTSANARHYYLTCARQLRGEGGTLKLNGAMMDVGKKQEDNG